MLELNRVGQCLQHHLNHWLKHLLGHKVRPGIVRLAHPVECLDRHELQTPQHRLRDQVRAGHFRLRFLDHGQRDLV